MRVQMGMAGDCSRRGLIALNAAYATLVAAGLLAAPQPVRGAVLTEASSPSQTSPASSSLPETSALALDKVLENTLAGGQSRTYRLTLSADQYAGLVVEQKGIEVVVRIVDPSANALADFDSKSRSKAKEHNGFVAESSGVYQLVVQAKYPRDPVAAYAIEVIEIRPATQTDRLLFQSRELSTQSQVQSDAGNYPEALHLAQNAVSLAKEASGPQPSGADNAYLGELESNLGAAQFAAGDRDGARASFEEAMRIDAAIPGGDSRQLAIALEGMGNVYIASSDYPRAQEVLERALKMLQDSEGNDSPGVADCLVILALLHQRRSEFPRALAELQHALTIDKQKLAPDDLATIKVMDSMADAYGDSGDFDHAIPALKQTLQIAEQKLGPNHPLVAHPLQNLGIIAREQQQYALALDYLWRAEKIREHSLGTQHASTAALLVNIANVYNAQGDYPRAIETYLRALAVLERAAGPYHEWTTMTLGNLARTYAAQGDAPNAVRYMARLNEAAETNLSLNLAIGSEAERLAYVDKYYPQTGRAISLNVTESPQDPAATELAAQMILQRKGRVLDAVADSMTALRKRLEPEDQKLLSDLSSTIAQLAKAALRGPGQTPPEQYQRQLEALQSQRERLETEISRRTAGYYQPAGSVTLAAVRKAIPADALLLEFAVYEPYDFHQPKRPGDAALRYVVYAIPAQGEVRSRDLGDAKEIDRQIDAYRQSLRDPKRTDSRQLARALDQILMLPLRSMEPDGKHLIISPDGELNLLPFESLVNEEGHYLIENYQIGYVTAGRDLLRMQVARSSHTEPLVIANPSFGNPETTPVVVSPPAKVRPASAAAVRRNENGDDMDDIYFAPLAGTAVEARELKSLFPDARILTGPEASKAELERVDSPAILHIATHGFFLENAADEKANKHAGNSAESSTRGIHAALSTDNPLLRSGLALAGANLDKNGIEVGILTALEASGLNLWGTKLVTLSACDTGVGEVKNGEGVYGLRRAFVIAGAETVVMSLWPVSDWVTRELMTSYYRGLKAGLGRGDALRQAQLAMLRQKGREHPFYWASFIQVGEWANLEGKR
jgi:CHAT domain-containing protein/tetratricopeptide (TPR) repeat protein